MFARRIDREELKFLHCFTEAVTPSQGETQRETSQASGGHGLLSQLASFPPGDKTQEVRQVDR